MPRLIGERIMLREYHRDDLKSIRSWVNDPAVTDTLSDVFMYPHTEQSSETFLNRMLQGGDGLKSFVIAEKESAAYS
ncbi:hypothetical protein [Saccharibacillus sacchari]|uniref:Uncharacterized protein n=1 Tax=Saccharibacillus sacchari TaxID=456493 RepID=A0ACC6P6A0_9BACL